MSVKINGEEIRITQAMIRAVKRTAKFYADEKLPRSNICVAAMEAEEFDHFWDLIGGLDSRDETKFVNALIREVWKK